MAIKRAEVFARRHGARIISITNEQAELIEHSTRGDTCGARRRVSPRPASSLPPALAVHLPSPTASEIDAICFNPIVPAATLRARRRCAA